MRLFLVKHERIGDHYVVSGTMVEAIGLWRATVSVVADEYATEEPDSIVHLSEDVLVGSAKKRR